MNTRLAALLVTLNTALCACGASVAAPARPITDPVAALGSQQRSRSQVQSIRAEARVDQRGAGGRIRGTVLMFVQRPDRVRFDVMTQFGPAAILTSDGSRFAYNDLREGRFLVGETCAANIARLLNVPLTVEQTTLLLLGGTPLIGHDSIRIGWHDDGFYRAVLESPSQGRQQIDLAVDERDQQAPPERQRLRLAKSEIFDVAGKSRWRATYDDYRDLALGGGRVTMPFQVRVEQPELDRDSLIKFKSIALNAAIPSDAFVQTARAGQTEEMASCDDQ
jgi:outer membrane lipoprotein-sorting protein